MPSYAKLMLNNAKQSKFQKLKFFCCCEIVSKYLNETDGPGEWHLWQVFHQPSACKSSLSGW